MKAITRYVPTRAKACPVCGAMFEGIDQQRYCSRRCRQKAYYWRDPERKRRYQRERRQKQEQEGGAR
jgi:predicted nucleic acid-binding Zn ribbon protein